MKEAKTSDQDIRSHWAIENKPYRVLDVTFKKEDMSRKGNRDENFGVFTKISINLMAKVDDIFSKRRKRIKAILSDQ